ncbi:phosphoribosyltransferase family protein, partial [Dietzia sp. UCD-THP]|uniref:phosphoribosyltransferase family protein n=1 Tax=Dietzia sp. UCD-THP TaxID=1292020 RepID=UPI003528EE74
GRGHHDHRELPAHRGDRPTGGRCRGGGRGDRRGPRHGGRRRDSGRPIDAFVVRKEAKKHGMQRRVEGPDIVGKRVLVVEDTTTTGNSPLTAVTALREAGAEVVGVATVVDRATGADDVIRAEGVDYRALLGLTDLGLE